MRRARAVVTTVFLVGATACAGDGPPDLHGTILDGSGAPFAGVRVDLAHAPADESVDERVWACATGQPACAAIASTTTDADGAFRFAASALPQDGTVTPAAALPSGTGAGLAFATVAVGDVASPMDLGAAPLASWAHDAPPRFQVDERWSDARLADGTLVWRAGGPATQPQPAGALSDAHIVEDWDVLALARDVSDALDLQAFSDATHVHGTQVPLSRGRACFVVDDAGDTAPLDPCPLTDGNLGTAFAGLGNPRDPSSAPRSLVIDLGAATPLAEVLVHDIGVEAATDSCTDRTLFVDELTDGQSMTNGQAWTPVGSTELPPGAPHQFRAVPLGGTARWVRLRLSACLDLATGPSEIAVY